MLMFTVLISTEFSYFLKVLLIHSVVYFPDSLAKQGGVVMCKRH